MYHCGSDYGWSDIFWFRTPPDPQVDPWSPTLAIYGDMGSENSVSLPRLQQEAQNGLYDAILHVGDFAYDMNTVSSTRGHSVSGPSSSPLTVDKATEFRSRTIAHMQKTEPTQGL